MELADLDPNPLVQLQRWLDDAIAEGLSHPTAMSLATANAFGTPSIRHVLVRLGAYRVAYYLALGSRPGKDPQAYALCVAAWALSYDRSGAGERAPELSVWIALSQLIQCAQTLSLDPGARGADSQLA